MFPKLALRDLVLVALLAGFWWLTAEHSAGEGPLSDFVGLLAGLGLGVSVYLLHEWGHLLGALATGSVVHAPESLGSRFLFSFDSKANSRRQFLTMSLTGFAVTGAALVAAYTVLPDGQLATRVARGAVLFLTFLLVFIELPLFLWALLRGSLPPVETFDAQPEVRDAGEGSTQAAA